MDYNKTLDKENIELFKSKGASIDSSKKIYHCVLCEHKVSINGSYSLRGHKLVCIACADKHFSSFVKTREWQQEDEK